MTADKVLVEDGEKGDSCKAVWNKEIRVGFVLGGLRGWGKRNAVAFVIPKNSSTIHIWYLPRQHSYHIIQ